MVENYTEYRRLMLLMFDRRETQSFARIQHPVVNRMIHEGLLEYAGMTGFPQTNFYQPEYRLTEAGKRELASILNKQAGTGVEK